MKTIILGKESVITKALEKKINDCDVFSTRKIDNIAFILNKIHKYKKFNIVFNNFYIITISIASPNIIANTILTFNSVTNRANYLSIFNTESPAYPAFHAGFDRKENKYVGNLRNFTPASNGEIIWGESISGVKGFYSLATFSTDTTTELGGNKQLFSVESSYIMNNGY